MKTTELIDLLSGTNATVDTSWLARRTIASAVAALPLAALVVLATNGPRLDLAEAWHTPSVILKFVFGACVALTSLKLLLASLRPGSGTGHGLSLVVLPFAAVAALAIATLWQAPSSEWAGLIFGRHWLPCLVLVPLYSLVVLALFIPLVRQGAPVEPRLTGILAGLSAGGFAVMAYALHCPDDAVPFLATWYALALGLSALTGALIMPRFTRW